MHSTLTPFQRFADDIERYYGIVPADISIAPRGYAAETYYVSTADSTFFLKIMNNPDRQAIFINGLKVLNGLVGQGIDFVPKIIPTLEGPLYFKKDSAVLAMFTKIDGKQSYSYNRRDVFEKLARIYRVSENIPDKGSFYKESFGDGFIGPYRDQVHSFMQGDVTGREAKEVKELLMPYADFLESCIPAAKEAVSQCKAQNAPFYLTHSDFPGNVMIADDGKQYLIDFDEAIYGPLERDGWLTIAQQNEESELWLSVMQEAFPGYKVNKAFISYYIYQRFMYDMMDFMKQLLHNPDEEYRKRIVDSTKNYLLGWLYPIMLKNG